MGIKNSQKVLVTGGAGYLGARVCSSLIAQGYDVSFGSRNSYPHRIVEGCNQVVTNWEDPELSFCKGFDLIIHAAGMNAKSCSESPDEALRFNGKLSEKLIEKAVSYGCKRFFYLSTVHVYQSPLVGIFDESSLTLNSHPYATSQCYGEEALIKALGSKNIAGAVLRLSNCFGPPVINSNECWNLVLNEFIKDAFLNRKITINGDYLSKRDFLPISEFNRVLLSILDFTESVPNVINVSTGASRTLLDVALEVSDTVTELTGTVIEIVKENSSETASNLSIENNALQRMGIYPSKDLTLEIRRMVDYLKLSI